MREMKDSGIEWIGQVPNNWKLKKGKYLFKQHNNRGNLKCLQLLSPSQKFGVIPQTLLEELTTQNVVKVSEKANLNDFKTVHVGDFCISLRSFQGGFEYSHYEGVVSPAYQIFSAIGDNLCDGYYRYLFKDKSFIDKMNSYTMTLRDGKNIAFDDFGNTYIPVPPKSEQEKIANFLDSQCSEIDAISADIQKEIEMLEQYKRSVITEAVTKGLNPDAEMKDSGIEWIGKIPLNWKLEKGKYLFRQRNSKGNNISLQLLSPSQKYGVIPQTLLEKLTTQNVVKTNERADLGNFKTIHKGDFCISLRSFQGGFEYSEYEGVVSPAYQVFYKVEPLYNNYYRYLFKENSFIKKMNSFTMTLRDGKNIAFSDFGDTYIPVPPLDEQEKIATFLNKKSSEIDSLVAEKKQQLEVLDSYKKSLIYEYVTGKKEVPLWKSNT